MLMLIIVMGQTQLFKETVLHWYKQGMVAKWKLSFLHIYKYLSCILLLILFCFGLIGYI